MPAVKAGAVVSVKLLLAPSVRTSTKLSSVSVTLPVLVTVMRYSTTSSVPLYPSPSSMIFAIVLLSVNDGDASMLVCVGSFVGSLSASASESVVESPSSLMSEIEVPAGLIASAVTLFRTPPASTACWSIT